MWGLACIFMHRSPELRMSAHAADRVFPDRRGAGTASVVHAAPAHGPLAVKLIAGHGAAGGPQRGPRPGRCDQVPNLGTSSRTAGDAGSRPWIIQRTGPRQAARARERHGRARLRFSSPGRGRTSLPGAPAPDPGITLSDEAVKENARGPADLHGGRSVTAWPAPGADLDDRRGCRRSVLPGRVLPSTSPKVRAASGPVLTGIRFEVP